jgi:hypothetical protein
MVSPWWWLREEIKMLGFDVKRSSCARSLPTLSIPAFQSSRQLCYMEVRDQSEDGNEGITQAISSSAAHITNQTLLTLLNGETFGSRGLGT